MNYRLFQYTLPAPSELEDLNAYLRAQRIASVAQHVVQTAGHAMLVFIVETVDPPTTKAGGPQASRIDYREQMSTEEFAVFSQLRGERKKWAEAEGVPVYTVFTNAQLAEMVRRRVRTPSDFGAIEGIGPARVEKYGPRLIAILADLSATLHPGEAK